MFNSLPNSLDEFRGMLDKSPARFNVFKSDQNKVFSPMYLLQIQSYVCNRMFIINSVKPQKCF